MNKPQINDISKTLTQTRFIHIAFSVGSKEKVYELTIKLKQDDYYVISGPRTTGDSCYESCMYYRHLRKSNRNNKIKDRVRFNYLNSILYFNLLLNIDITNLFNSKYYHLGINHW